MALINNMKNVIDKIRKSSRYDYQLLDTIRAIKKEEEVRNLRNFFNLSIDMICVIDANGYFKEISNSFERTLGYTKKELLLKQWNYFVIDEDQKLTIEEIARLKNGNHTCNFENRYTCKDGSIKYLEWRAALSTEDKLIYAVARDISNHKNEEKKLKRRNQQLEISEQERLESLRYSRLLQEAILQDPDKLNSIFTDSFIYNSPKNIVSGDFYWFEKQGMNVTIAGADCTGHGMPGALLSILGMSMLHDIIGSSKVITPGKILDQLNETIYNALGKKNGVKQMNDGMDLGLFSINLKSNILQYAGAKNSLYIIRNKSLIKISADRKSIGSSLNGGVFENHTIEVKTGDMIYIFTDGLVDQFGSEKNKKFGFKRLSELLLSIHEFPATDQKEILKCAIEKWKGNLDQTDDILAIGVRI